MTTRRRRGATIVEALVAAVLAGAALAALAAGATLARRALVAARDASTALALAGAGIEALRAGPRTAGGDAVAAPDGTVFTRTWDATGGRGAPVTLRARVAWGARAEELVTEAWP